MAKKRVGLGNLSFNKIDPYGRPERERVAGARTLHIEAVRPDPCQPRSLLPPELRKQFQEGSLSPAAALRAWLEQAESDRASPAATRAAAAVRTLAASIASQGLINPITVRPVEGDEAVQPGVAYLIVTGERRWWAHVLLTLEERPIQEGEETHPPDRIKATDVTPGVAIRAHQLIENLMREDIGLLERAQGMVALKEELTTLQQQDQPAGRSTWGDVEKVLGISRPYRVRTLKVLDLCAEAQALVAAHNLTERAIRPITEKLADYPKLQVAALEQLLTWQQTDEGPARTGPALVRLVEQWRAAEQQPEAAEAPPAIAPAAPRLTPARLRRRVHTLLGLLAPLDEAGRREASEALAHDEKLAASLRQLRSLLDELLPE